jgi:uncharacterized protein YxjI
MRQKLFAMGDDFIIKDSDSRDVYFVDGKVFTLHERMLFKDMQGNELASIQHRLLSWGPTYEISRNGQVAAVVKESLFTLLGHRFSVDVPGTDDLETNGNFTDHEYVFTRSGRAVATVSKRWFSLADTYGVDVVDGEDDVLILASTVVIERCAQDQSHHQ